MRHHRITTPELALVGSTRGMLGAGIGLLLAGRMNTDQRRTAGLVLLLVGIVTTVPLVFEILGRRQTRPLPPLTLAE